VSSLEPVSAGLPPQCMRALRAVAELRGVAMAQVVREALTAYLDLGELTPEVLTWRERQRALARQVAAGPPPAAPRCIVEALRSGAYHDLASALRAGRLAS
jgi:hypothetical protein